MKKLPAERFGHCLEGNGSEEKPMKDPRQWREMINLCIIGISLGKEEYERAWG